MIISLCIGYLMGWVGSMPVAGVVSIFVFQRGLAGRIRDGLLFSAGAAIAEALWCSAARYGAGKVLGRWPAVGPAAEVVGGLILILLGLYFVFLKKDLPPYSNDAAALTVLREIGLGFGLVAGNLAIPINWVAMVTIVYSLGFDPFHGPPGSFSTGVALGIMSWFTLMLLLLDRFRSRFTVHSLSRMMKVMGSLLVGAGVVALVRSQM
jgi:threonine/homoserine/homoserine lactone efflux protein